MNIYVNGKIILENTILENHIVQADKKIKRICHASDYSIKAHDTVIDLQGYYMSPGFVNVHIHGSNGHDTMDGSNKALRGISSILPHSGVTSYLATTMTMEKELIYQALSCVQKFIRGDHHRGAELLGVHAEGPFISEQYKGAQNPKFIEPPTYKFYEPFYDIIKLITLAPEKDENFKFASTLKAQHKNIILSIGHSSATYDIAHKAFEHNYNHITHLFNAMTGLHHREPGIVGAAFTHNFYTELIADNVHVRPELYEMIVKNIGKDYLILITDAMCAACLSPGIYALGGQEVIVDDKSARLKTGALAGSILTMNQAIKNIYNNTSLNLYEAVNLASKNPATELGLYDRIGSIAVNKDADFVIFDDAFIIHQTYCKGQLAYSKEEHHAT